MLCTRQVRPAARHRLQQRRAAREHRARHHRQTPHTHSLPTPHESVVPPHLESVVHAATGRHPPPPPPTPHESIVHRRPPSPSSAVSALSSFSCTARQVLLDLTLVQRCAPPYHPTPLACVPRGAVMTQAAGAGMDGRVALRGDGGGLRRRHAGVAPQVSQTEGAGCVARLVGRSECGATSPVSRAQLTPVSTLRVSLCAV